MTTHRTITDQIRGTTQRERFLQLQAELRTFSEKADPKEYETALYRFLGEFERLRLNTEAQMLKLQKELSFCEGTADACATVANTLVSVLRRYREELKRESAPPVQVQADAKEPAIKTDTDVLKTICVCGCQDAEDAADCNCSCHKGVPCDDEKCVVCRAKKEELAQTTNKQKKKKKAAPRKKTTKKTTQKRKTTKKKST